MDTRANDPAAAAEAAKLVENLEPAKLPERIALDKEVRFILGRPNFWCSPFAKMLRKRGFEIAFKAEDEQAAVIHWMLNIYFEHGKEWRNVVDRIVREETKELEG